MTQIPSDDILLEILYKLRIWESEQLKTVLELYNMQIHQKKAELDYHRLKTMVKKKYRAEFENEELKSQKWKFWNKRRGQESEGKTAWKANGQCSKGDNCSFRHDKFQRGKATQPNPSPRSSTRQTEKKRIENQKSQRQKSKRENGSTAVQGLPQRNLHNSVLWKMASSGVLVLQVRKWMQIWG